MKQFKQLTVDELMKLLIDLARENESQAKEYNNSITLLSKSELSISEKRKKINELHNLVRDLVNENRSFVSLFKGLGDFYKFFNDRVEHSDEAGEAELEAVEMDISEEEIMQNMAEKNHEELNMLMERYIAEENYEECAKIKELIEKTA
jgi:hypothetical protein